MRVTMATGFAPPILAMAVMLAAPARAADPAPDAAACAANPAALGVSRVVEIDTTGGPAFGSQQYHGHEFLADHEVVLTFDDGPLPAYTVPVLKALAAHCTQATFFTVGRNATTFPETLRQIEAAGHTIGAHTWSHADLGPRRRHLPPVISSFGGGYGGYSLFGPPPAPKVISRGETVMLPPIPTEKAAAEIERGFSAASSVLGHPIAPFFRFPYLSQTERLRGYLAGRNIAIFSIDVDALDYRIKRPDEMVARVLAELERSRKGIMLFHDIQPSTAQGLPRLLDELKARGYRVVHIKPKTELLTVAAHDISIAAERTPKADAQAPHPLARRSIVALAGPPPHPALPAAAKVRFRAPPAAPSAPRWEMNWNAR